VVLLLVQMVVQNMVLDRAALIQLLGSNGERIMGPCAKGSGKTPKAFQLHAAAKA